MEKLPLYKMFINEDDADESEVSFVALVDRPAIERNFLAFASEQKFAINKDRRIITGALMIADLPIYRNNKDLGEFYVMFDAKEIEKIVLKFFRKGYTRNVNEMHDLSKTVDGVYMFESFIVDEQRGITAPKGITGVTNGSWIGSYKVDNDAVWKSILKGEFQGFSVEGMFDMKISKKTVEQEIVETIEDIEKL